jgi:hypothetical protein
MTAQAIHRVGQFWRHSSARVSAAELQRAKDILGPQLSGFFMELPVNDRRHGLDVLATIDRNLPGAPRLLQQAALLHDMGKSGARLSVVERSAVVLLGALSQRGLQAALRARPSLGRRFEIYREHSRIGAARLERAGAAELAAIVREHHDAHPQLEMTSALQLADHAN